MVYSITDVAIAMVGELELADVGTSGRRLTDIREGEGLWGKGVLLWEPFEQMLFTQIFLPILRPVYLENHILPACV